jgi:hypothetical protein
VLLIFNLHEIRPPLVAGGATTRDPLGSVRPLTAFRGEFRGLTLSSDAKGLDKSDSARQIAASLDRFYLRAKKRFGISILKNLRFEGWARRFSVHTVAVSKSVPVKARALTFIVSSSASMVEKPARAPLVRSYSVPAPTT